MLDLKYILKVGALLDMPTDNTLPPSTGVTEESIRIAFDQMRVAESESYAASDKARKARTEWERLICEKVLRGYPDIADLAAKAKSLQSQLDEVTNQLSQRIEQTGYDSDLVQRCFS